LQFEERLAAVQEQCAREVKKGREQWAAAEKVKREQWMADKVKEVKDMTIKGLEPQVQRLIEVRHVLFLNV
jgi:5-azacytidine-induced protein 1